MGKHHARIYSEMNEVELVGVADVDERRASEVAAKYNTEAFTDYERLLKKKSYSYGNRGGVAHADYLEQSLEIRE